MGFVAKVTRKVEDVYVFASEEEAACRALDIKRISCNSNVEVEIAPTIKKPSHELTVGCSSTTITDLISKANVLETHLA
jgi:hypothetical protein